MKIRNALLSEANELSELALHSKATWNYSEAFILACKEDLTITDEYIKNNFVYVLENDNTKIGFFSFLHNDNALDFLYIHPRYKGKGFYLKMGAKLIGETPSTVFEDRLLPLLQHDV